MGGLVVSNKLLCGTLVICVSGSGSSACSAALGFSRTFGFSGDGVCVCVCVCVVGVCVCVCKCVCVCVLRGCWWRYGAAVAVEWASSLSFSFFNAFSRMLAAECLWLDSQGCGRRKTVCLLL